jgi:peptide/nickel transport system substrate-binding protein
MTRRQWIFSTAAAAAGCSAKRRIVPAGNLLTVLYPHDETVLGPEMNEPAQFLMFLPLVAWNTRGELEGRLAEHWEHSPDYRTWTIRLRDGIRWHDGVPVTAHDIKFNLDLRSHPDVLWFEPDSYAVRVIDDLTYSITYQRDGLPGSARDDWTVYYPKHIIEKFDPKGFYGLDFWTHPVGNGPYRHVRTVPKTMMQLEANADYYRGMPKTPDVILKFGNPDPAGTAAVIELLSGAADAATEVNRTDVLKLSSDRRFRVYHQLHDELVTVLFWNHRHHLFSDPKVRKALTLGINRRELFQLLTFPNDTPIVDGPFSKRQMRLREFPDPIPFDPGLANRLLDEAGWSRRTPQGIRERAGIPFSFDVIYGSQAGAGQYESAVYIQSQLKRIGVAMNSAPREGSSFVRVVTGDYEAAISIMFTNWSDRRFLPTAGYSNPRFRELTDRLGAALDTDEQDVVCTELTKLFQEDVPATFLYPDVLTTIAANRIRGLDTAPYPGDLTWCMDQLSLEGQN